MQAKKWGRRRGGVCEGIRLLYFCCFPTLLKFSNCSPFALFFFKDFPLLREGDSRFV